MKKYSMIEISKHNTVTDCWVVIQHRVYNLTEYLDFHPGGKKILLKFAGTDCTELFCRIHGNKNMKDLMDRFYIGDLEKMMKDNL